MDAKNHASIVKVLLRDQHGGFTETLWATQIEPNLYQLDNSPFFAYGVSGEDIVEARLNNDNFLEFVRCVKKSGNRTIRVIFQDCKTTDPHAENVLKGLRDLGCSYEGMQPRLISINIPRQVRLSDVTDYLKKESGLQWEYADPTYEQLMHASN